jgi:hypothetical protein
MANVLTADERAEAIVAAWTFGQLDFTLTKIGRFIKRDWLASLNKDILFVANCTRKGTKTCAAFTIATELCIQRPGFRVIFLAPVEGSVENYAQDVCKQVFSTCPKGLMPKINRSQVLWPNDSMITFGGLGRGTAGGSYNNPRSFTFDLAIVDEASFTGSLETIIEDVLTPCVLPRSGHIIMLSTPPEVADHPFKKYCEKAKDKGCYSEYTIDDSHYPKDQIERFITAMGGRDSAKCQREFFGKFVIDKDILIVPEFSMEHVQYIEKDECYEFYHKIVSLDL